MHIIRWKELRTFTTEKLTSLKRTKEAHNQRVRISKENKVREGITATTPSLAESTRISAQETTPGHSLSTASLMVSMYLKFLSPKLLSVSFSDKALLVESSSSEASQLYTLIKPTHQKHFTSKQ